MFSEHSTAQTKPSGLRLLAPARPQRLSHQLTGFDDPVWLFEVRWREWEALAGQVYEAWAHRALEAAQAKDEHGNYVVSHAQSMVPCGIAKDGLRTVLDAINPRGFGDNQMNVQFWLVSRSQFEAEERAKAGGKGEVIEGEAREIPAEE